MFILVADQSGKLFQGSLTVKERKHQDIVIQHSDYMVISDYMFLLAGMLDQGWRVRILRDDMQVQYNSVEGAL